MTPRLPLHLSVLVASASAGTLPSSPVLLKSGLVVNVTIYVLAWAECDRVTPHVLSRLEEAYAAVGGGQMTEYFEIACPINDYPQYPNLAPEYRVVTSTKLARIKFQGSPVFGGPPWKGKKIRYLGHVFTVTRGWSQTRHGITTYRLSVMPEPT